MEFDITNQQLSLPPVLSFVVKETGNEVVSKGFNATVGRSRTSSMQIKDCSVSERHAVVSWTGQHWQLCDTGSSNGTMHNGVKLRPERDVVTIKTGDILQLGDVEVTVMCEPCQASDITVEQLLQSQLEAMTQALLAATINCRIQPLWNANARHDIRTLNDTWQVARAELTAVQHNTTVQSLPVR